METHQTKTISIKLPSSQTLSRISVPLAILVSGVLISGSLLIAGVNIKNSLKNLSTTTGTTTSQQTATTTATTTPAPVAPSSTVSIAQVKTIFDSNKYIKFGNSSAKNLIVEFTDPSCPFCHVAGGKDPQLNKQMATQFILSADGGTYVAPIEEIRNLVNQGQASLAIIYTTGHSSGKLGMQALYCAYDQNKFWEAHDLLMSNNGYNLLNNDVKNDIANSSKLTDFLSPAVDKSTMLSCLQSGKYISRIADEDQLAQSLGILGTPGFYVNTSVFSGAVSYKDMQSAIIKS